MYSRIAGLLLLAAAACAEETRTLIVVEPGPEGHRAIAADGSRLVIRGSAADVAAEQGVVTLGLEPASEEEGAFDAVWIRAVAVRSLRLPTGQFVPLGSGLEVVARRDDEPAGEVQPGELPLTRWQVRLPDGALAWLDPADGEGIELRADEGSGLSDGWIEGVVERMGERVSLLALDGRRVAIEGELARVVARNLGRFVQGYAVLHPRGGRLVAHVLELSATTRDACEGVQVSAPLEGTPPGQLRLARSEELVREDDLLIGQEWIDVSGVVIDKGDASPRYAIRSPSMDLGVAKGDDGGFIHEEVLADSVGRRVWVRGHVATEGPARGRLVLRSVEATLGIELPATREAPAVAAGTKVRVVELNDPLTCRIALPDGRVRELSRANPRALLVGEPR